jgi:hypothetical protein
VRSSSSPSAAGGSKRRSTSSCLLCCALAAPQEASMILQGAREELANEGGLNTSRAAGVIDKSIATRHSPIAAPIVAFAVGVRVLWLEENRVVYLSLLCPLRRRNR